MMTVIHREPDAEQRIGIGWNQALSLSAIQFNPLPDRARNSITKALGGREENEQIG